MSVFADLSLPGFLLQSLEGLGYTQPTPVQQQAIPLVLAGNDVVGQAETGSGKTAAYILPALSNININVQEIQVLVLVPTRELAQQVKQEAKKLGKFLPQLKTDAFYGGHSFYEEEQSLLHPPQLLIATPGRLSDHFSRRTINTDAIRLVVLDEADKLLEMGFEEDLNYILGMVPKGRQSLLFSATMPDAVTRLIGRSLSNPAFLKTEASANPATIKQVVYATEESRKAEGVIKLLQQLEPEKAIIFCNTRAQTMDTARQLIKAGFYCSELHGELEQQERDKSLLTFKNGSAPILVATDLAARGIHIHELETIINYEVPSDPESFLHRSGRTGRAGLSGTVYTFATSREAELIRSWKEEVTIDEWKESKDLPSAQPGFTPTLPAWATLHISAGKRDKVSARDIVGSLMATAGLKNDQVGKIEVFDRFSYVAVPFAKKLEMVEKLNKSKIKGVKVKVSVIR